MGARLNRRCFEKNAHSHIGVARPPVGRAIAKTDRGIRALQGFNHEAHAIVNAFELGMAPVI